MYTNTKNIPLSVAVFLATDNYDHSSDPKEISVTTLIKPTRQIVLQARAQEETPESAGVGDISDLVPSRLGTAVHEGIENAWMKPQAAMTKLGYSKAVVDSIVVNPEPSEVQEGQLPVYLEKRTKKEIAGRIVSGCFDFCGGGSLGDFKNTGTFMFTKKKSDGKYILQGSIYRWLNPDIVTDDVMHIYFIFKDWSANKAKGSDSYPQSSVHDYRLNMMTYEDTEKYIKDKINEIHKCMEMKESQLPLCSDEDLWMDESEYKYYAKADAKRATKNFGTDAASAYHHRALKGVGEVREIKAEPKACKWCTAVSCSQRDGYISSGILTL